MKPLLLSGLLAGLVAANSMAQQPRKDEDMIQGTWKVTSAWEAGKKDPSALKFVFVFKNGTMTATIDGKQKGKGTYRLDPSKKPKWFDVTMEGRPYLGIYELKGDTLRICHSHSRERPTRFVSEDDPRQRSLIILQRVKPKAK